MPVEMKRVLSSHVLEVGYDPESQELHVRFAPSVKNPSGPVVAYQGVGADVAERVMKSPSVGSAIHAEIRGNFTVRPVE